MAREAGLGACTSPSEAVTGRELLVWFSSGFTHISRPENDPGLADRDDPLSTRTSGFFAQNFALAVGDQAA
ncbi:MAG TPA: hypothetical protein VHZ95_06335, partial [Polyangiales bacterium]|nr:hypothetical protein [Polyangiales bacterium]